MANESKSPSVIYTNNASRIFEAIKTIQSGYCKRVDVCDNIKVYECGKNVIRIDIKHKYEH